MSRDLEHNLRALEILFTLAFNKARQNDQSNAFKIYEKNYEKIIQVRFTVLISFKIIAFKSYYQKVFLQINNLLFNYFSTSFPSRLDETSDSSSIMTQSPAPARRT